VRRLYIEIPELTYREAMRRAIEERRSTREQVGYDLERLYEATDDVRSEPRREPAEVVR
jgi:hypothetical protein